MFSFFGKSKIRGRAGLALTADGLAYAGLATGAESPVLKTCGFALAEQSDDLQQLQALASQESLCGYQLAVCLDRSRFNLSQVEAPPVEEEEMLQALTWRVKELIDFPLDELVLDYVDIPPTKSGGGMIYTVTSQQSTIQNIVDRANTGEGLLERIDIPALALQNIACRLPQANEGIALLNLCQRDSLLTLGRGDKLYLSRGVDATSTDLRIGIPPLANTQILTLFDSLLLDIQRSLDYYDSFFTDPPIRHLLVPAGDELLDGLIDYLNANLAIDVRRLSMEDLLATGEELSIDPERFGELMLALGAALWRRELAA